MAYKKQTEYFGIPFVSKGEAIQEDEESRKYNIIENQLVAALKGNHCCVIGDGEYRLVQSVNSYTVALVGIGQKPALEGIIRGGYCLSRKPVLWENLKKGKIYHLYAVYTDTMYRDETSFAVRVKERNPYPESELYLYLASVDLKTEPYGINSKPVGKIYGNSFVQNRADIEAVSNGPEGMGLDFSAGNILNVAVEERFENTPTFQLGQIVTKITNNGVMVYNSGAKGIPITVSILYNRG